MTSMKEREGTAPCSTRKLHRKSRSAAASQPGMRAVSNPFTFGILKRTTPPESTPSKEDLAGVGAPEPKAERQMMLSPLQSWHGRDYLGSRPSISITKSGASASGSEDGGVVEPGRGPGSVPAVQKESAWQAQSQSSTTHHNAELYFPIVLLGPPLTSNNGPTPPADVVPPHR